MTIRSLAIETSSRMGSVALAEDGRTILEDTFPHGLQNAARIVPSIDALTRRLGWTPRDLAEIYVSAGPGSFTGLRIGITLAKTLAFVTGAKLVAVPSVRVIAENAPADADFIVIVLDAKRDQIFTASFQRTQDDWKEIEPARLSSLSEVLARTPRPASLIGEGIPWHQKFLDAADKQIHITQESLWRPRAAAVATLGWKMARRGEFANSHSLTPIYIRRPEAEEKFDADLRKR
jgi:tRNA threonylcarbamoyladenosine biosynthesis protein TsaB